MRPPRPVGVAVAAPVVAVAPVAVQQHRLNRLLDFRTGQ
jgi:hypothetical protein